ncbi:MAG: NAD-dependent epimerase/dehydratase family protein [Flavobacteriales bacterium]|nr:NAD-dependent epimerase/dehydratase family protein [Flavobacteriales bacterium]MCX7768555.1 NAD-dependent epimerase/dehydratase family protein [Flavobacteriales bacterium]MDW8409476.1 NAD-dependent epimerase/dehydratase family protein [Flavobacteriales bacterium]
MEQVNILVTGGAGFIGSAMAEKLSEFPGAQVVIVDNLSTGSEKKVPRKDNIKFIVCDVNNYEEIQNVFFRFGFHYVFHYAAVVGVQRTLSNPLAVLRDIKGLENILTLSKTTGVQHVYFSSSSEVYGEPVEFPQNEETTPLNSRLPYAIVKNVGEAFLKAFYQEYNLPYTVFRFFNTYGPKQSRDFVISKFIAAALKNEPLTIYGDGTQSRTFCYIDDNVDACYNAFTKKMFVNDVVNIGSDVEFPIIRVAELIIRLTGSRSKIEFLPKLKEGDMTRRKPDISKMRKLLDRPLIDLEEGIKKILENPQYIL